MAKLEQCDVCGEQTEESFLGLSLYDPKTDKSRNWDICPKCVKAILKLLPTAKAE